MTGTILQKLQSIGVGVVAAVITVVALDHYRERPMPASPTKQQASPGSQPPVATPTFRTVIVDGKAYDNLSAIEDRLQKLEEGKAASAAQAEEDPVDEARQQREATEEWTRMERGHDADMQDREWAPSAQRRFEEGLKPVSEELGFKVTAAECKTTTCRATVTFPNYAAARKDGMHVIERVYGGLNCMRRISLDAPQNPNEPYTTKLYLDCADQRAGLVEELAAN